MRQAWRTASVVEISYHILIHSLCEWHVWLCDLMGSFFKLKPKKKHSYECFFQKPEWDWICLQWNNKTHEHVIISSVTCCCSTCIKTTSEWLICIVLNKIFCIDVLLKAAMACFLFYLSLSQKRSCSAQVVLRSPLPKELWKDSPGF